MPNFQDDEGRREALYAALPALVILDPGLKPGTVRLYAYLRLRKGQNYKATTTIKGIGLGLGIGEKTLYDHIKELESRHYLRRQREGFGKPMTYILPTMEEVWHRMNPTQRQEVKDALLAYGFKEDHLTALGVVETTDSIPSSFSSSVEKHEDISDISTEYGENEEQNINNPGTNIKIEHKVVATLQEDVESDVPGPDYDPTQAEWESWTERKRRRWGLQFKRSILDVYWEEHKRAFGVPPKFSLHGKPNGSALIGAIGRRLETAWPSQIRAVFRYAFAVKESDDKFVSDNRGNPLALLSDGVFNRISLVADEWFPDA